MDSFGTTLLFYSIEVYYADGLLLSGGGYCLCVIGINMAVRFVWTRDYDSGIYWRHYSLFSNEDNSAGNAVDFYLGGLCKDVAVL